MTGVGFWLPWPPSVNRYWRHGRGRTYIAKPGAQYRQEVHRLTTGILYEPLAGRLCVRLTAFPPDNRLRDIDNIAKALLDALEGRVFVNDSQIDHLIIRRGAKRVGGQVWVDIDTVDGVVNECKGDG